MGMKDIDAYLEQHRERFEEELCELLRIPSVSADPSHKADVERAAEWVAGQFRQIGLAAQVIPTAGHPLVFAQSPPAPGMPVVLVYGHYDVQPPDPLDEWITPPFEPTRRDGNLVARGATDDKGQMFTHVKSVQAWLESRSELPIQVKFLIEGEEEVGSEGLNAFLATSDGRDLLACDVVVVSDTSQFRRDQPAITYGLRGIAYFELVARGPRQDLHSGVFGGAVINPAIALARMLAALIDDAGRVQVPGFYDDVLPLTDAERRQFAELPFDEPAFQQQLGVNALGGEEGYSTIERRWARPTFDVHGLTSGYQGEGAKTVLPARASAKFSFRLVPHQNPDKIVAGLRALLERIAPRGVTWELLEHHHAPGIVMKLGSPHMEAAARAIEHGFGKRPVFIREGGSIPIVNVFAEQLGVDTLLLGWGLDDDNTHSPNEKFSLHDFHRGIRSSARLWHELSQTEARR
jgi:succinyl-diaminopimelate desuccinylase